MSEKLPKLDHSKWITKFELMSLATKLKFGNNTFNTINEMFKQFDYINIGQEERDLHFGVEHFHIPDENVDDDSLFLTSNFNRLDIRRRFLRIIDIFDSSIGHSLCKSGIKYTLTTSLVETANVISLTLTKISTNYGYFRIIGYNTKDDRLRISLYNLGSLDKKQLKRIFDCNVSGVCLMSDNDELGKDGFIITGDKYHLPCWVFTLYTNTLVSHLIIGNFCYEYLYYNIPSGRKINILYDQYNSIRYSGELTVISRKFPTVIISGKNIVMTTKTGIYSVDFNEDGKQTRCETIKEYSLIDQLD